MGPCHFGLVYRALPHWADGKPPALGVARAHFYVSVVGTLGAWANGTFGYAALSLLEPGRPK